MVAGATNKNLSLGSSLWQQTTIGRVIGMGKRAFHKLPVVANGVGAIAGFSMIILGLIKRGGVPTNINIGKTVLYLPTTFHKGYLFGGISLFSLCASNVYFLRDYSFNQDDKKIMQEIKQRNLDLKKILKLAKLLPKEFNLLIDSLVSNNKEVAKNISEVHKSIKLKGKELQKMDKTLEKYKKESDKWKAKGVDDQKIIKNLTDKINRLEQLKKETTKEVISLTNQLKELQEQGEENLQATKEMTEATEQFTREMKHRKGPHAQLNRVIQKLSKDLKKEKVDRKNLSYTVKKFKSFLEVLPALVDQMNEISTYNKESDKQVDLNRRNLKEYTEDLEKRSKKRKKFSSKVDALLEALKQDERNSSPLLERKISQNFSKNKRATPGAIWLLVRQKINEKINKK